MITLVSGSRSRMRRAASIPVERGIRTSMSTTSGASSSARWTASMPSAASPTTLMSGSSDSTRSSPRRNSAWSSQITIRMVPPSLILGLASKTGTRLRRRSLPRPSPAGLDQAEVAVATTVEDGRMTVLAVREQEEVVTEELHLERGFLGAHGLRREPLGLDDPRAFVVAVGSELRHELGFEIGRGPVAAPRVRARDALLLDPGDLVLDLVDDEVQRCARLRRRRMGLHEVPLQVDRDVTDLVV